MATFSSAEFIEGYIEAFQAFDAARIAAFYNDPCLSIRPDGSLYSFSSKSEIETFFVAVVEAYRSEGMAFFSASEVHCQAKGAMSASLTCSWAMTRQDGSVIRTWEQTYMFHRVASHWKIIASVFHQA